MQSLYEYIFPRILCSCSKLDRGIDKSQKVSFYKRIWLTLGSHAVHYGLGKKCRLMIDSLRTFFTPIAANFSISYFLWRKEPGSFWLAAAFSVKKEMNFEVKACNPDPLIQRHLLTLRERLGEWLGLHNVFTQAQTHTPMGMRTSQ